MGSGGERGDEVWADRCPERNIRCQFQSKGSNPLMLEQRNCRARGIFNRLHEDGRFADEAALNEIQYCTNTMLNHGGPPAYQVAF